MFERVVVVGHGAITCLGRDMDATWAGLIAGRSGLARHDALDPERFLRDVGGLVEGFGPGTAGEEVSVAKLEAKSIHLAMAAARMAWADAGLDRAVAETDYDPHRVAVSIGSAFGGHDLLEIEVARTARRKSLAASPYLVPGLVINQSSGQVAQALGLYGASVSPANACAAGGHAIAMGGMFLRSGMADLAVCGGTESAFTPPIVNGFATMKALASRKPGDRAFDDPSRLSRPFSVDRNGFVMAEGAAVLVLATEANARRLGLKIQAELLGWGMNSDAHHMTTPHPGRIAELLKRTLSQAGLRPDQVDYYNAHGTSTPVNDRVETEVVKDVFGEHARRMPISSNSVSAIPAAALQLNALNDPADVNLGIAACNAAWSARSGGNLDIQRGDSWATGGMAMTLFNTVVTPNGSNDTWAYCGSNNSGTMANFSNSDSYHPGGVNVLMADGHVSLIKNSINPNIWWALGTVNGGEVISGDSY